VILLRESFVLPTNLLAAAPKDGPPVRIEGEVDPPNTSAAVEPKFLHVRIA
jgi:hypothetical protein